MAVSMLHADLASDDARERVLLQLEAMHDELDCYVFLNRLWATDETLFYDVVMSDPTRFFRLIYAPTIGRAALDFHRLAYRPPGMYVSIEQRGRIREVLANWPHKDVRIICVTTGGRVLGLGDLGANGMAIAVAKAQVYTACASVPPGAVLPAVLDCGTDNLSLLADPMYHGVRRRRPSLQEMDEFVDEFIEAVQDVFPGCAIHFEDWNGVQALRYLARYRDRVCCYNDDIQGTAGVVLAGLINAMRIAGKQLEDQRFLFFGAGASALGTADLLVAAMARAGFSQERARRAIWLYDAGGLIESTRQGLLPEQRAYAQEHAPSSDLLAVINSIEPSVLIGLSTAGGAFDRAVVERMSALNDHPVIFALSIPGAECAPENAYAWSGGKAIYAAGVQFPAVSVNGKIRTPSQANNFYVTPALGLAIYTAKPNRVTDDVFIEAAHAVADQVTAKQLRNGMLFPPQSVMLETSLRTAPRIASVFPAS